MTVRALRFYSLFLISAVVFGLVLGFVILPESPVRAAFVDGIVLEQNYPNPFTTTTEIQFYIPMNGHVLIRVFNTLGQEVGRPIDDDKSMGRYAVKFDGSALPSGQYAYTLYFTSDVDRSTGKQTRKMYLLR